MFRSWIASAALLALTAGAAAPAGAQRVDPTRIIEMHLNAEADNQSFDAAVVEGQSFRMSFKGTGAFEIAPVLVNAAAGRFRVTVFAGAEGADRSTFRIAETVEARRGVPVALRSMPSVSLVIDGVRTVDAKPAAARSISYQVAATPEMRSLFGAPFGRCCISCGIVTACGCAVDMDCGYCCSDPCCPPPIETSGRRYFSAPRRFAAGPGGCGKPINDAERILTPRGGRTAIASR